MDFTLASIAGAEIKNKKTGNVIVSNIEAFKAIGSGKEKFCGKDWTGKQVSWLAKNCEIIELDGFNIEVKIV